MLSILIPVYNYDISKLVESLIQQISTLHVNYELIVMDDASTDTHCILQNKQIDRFENCSYHLQNSNLGRTATRLHLAEKATFSWLLFLDADVMPLRENFIDVILNNLHEDIDFIFGGIQYQIEKPDKPKVLRWQYGKSKEMRSTKERMEMPYSSIISQNFVIKKSIALQLLEKIKSNRYGLDILFSYELQKESIRILHIDNPTVHLGLEDTATFIRKSIESLYTTNYYENMSRIPRDYRPIQKSYLFLRKIGVCNVYKVGISWVEKILLKNSYSNNPSIFLFDLYRLYYYILINEKEKTT